MKLTEVERRVLFDALTLYKKTYDLWRTYTPEQTAEAEAISALRSKLKKVFAENA